VAVVPPGVRGIRVLGRAAVAVIAAVHLLLCAPHASDMGADSTAVWAAIAGFAHHHATATDISQTPHGTSLDVAGGDGPNVEHDCVTVAVKHRPGGDGVPASTGPPLPLSCASPGAAGPPARLLWAVPESNPTGCLILRC
jgi:hypothetical protein